MMRLVTTMLALLVGFALPTFAQTNQASRPGAAPATDAFLSKAAVGNLFEIESSKLAQSKTKTDKVQQFAALMIKDHTEAAAKFKQAVAEAKLSAPPERLDTKHAGVVDSLRRVDGSAFDAAYVEAQTQAHVETVELFEAYAQGGDNARMRKFAQDMLPTLRSHLSHVRGMQ